jgi:hypothetical protein
MRSLAQINYTRQVEDTVRISDWSIVENALLHPSGSLRLNFEEKIGGYIRKHQLLDRGTSYQKSRLIYQIPRIHKIDIVAVSPLVQVLLTARRVGDIRINLGGIGIRRIHSSVIRFIVHTQSTNWSSL